MRKYLSSLLVIFLLITLSFCQQDDATEAATFDELEAIMTQDQIDALNDPYQELTGDGLAKWCKEDCYQIHIICRDESETRA